jgi:hypothetical protein
VVRRRQRIWTGIILPQHFLRRLWLPPEDSCTPPSPSLSLSAPSWVCAVQRRGLSHLSPLWCPQCLFPERGDDAAQNDTRSALYSIQSSVDTPTCPGDERAYSLLYSWSVGEQQSGGEQQRVQSAGRDRTAFLIAPHSLLTARLYIVQLTVTIKESLRSAAASTVVYVAPGEVVSGIRGGLTRNMKVSTSSSIDASSSYDEDLTGVVGVAAGLRFAWSCRIVSPVLNVSCASALRLMTGSDASRLVVEATSSAGTQCRITLLVSDLTGERSSSSTVAVTLLALNDPILAVTSNALNGMVNPDSPLQLTGTVLLAALGNASLSAKWSVNASDVNLTAVALTPTTSYSLGSLRNTVYLAISPLSVPAGVTLAFTLSCGLASSSSSSSSSSSFSTSFSSSTYFSSSTSSSSSSSPFPAPLTQTVAAAATA